MKYAVFFRNLNLGRPNCPTRAQFEAAFLHAGASTAASFLTNGTLVFSVREGLRARPVLAAACERLRVVCGLREPAFLRRVGDLADRVAERPFASVAPGSVFACCVTFLHPDHDPLQTLPRETRRGDVRVLQSTGTEVFSVCFKVGKSPGSPNLMLEKGLGLPATSRNWSTVERLVARHGP